MATSYMRIVMVSLYDTTSIISRTWSYRSKRSSDNCRWLSSIS